MDQSINQGVLDYSSIKNENLLEDIRVYWNSHIHDLSIATHPVGSAGFFEELDEYRFDKLAYLPRLVDFSAYSGKSLLEVGCGAGIDLARFAKGGAKTTGVDLSETAIELAKKNFEHRQLPGDFYVMNAEELEFDQDSFDVVYAHGVLQYTADAPKMVAELYRVLRPGGKAIFMVYNRYSWLNALSKFMKVDLEHDDAPVFKTYSITELKDLLRPFSRLEITPERFPVKSRLQQGLKARLYNQFFVGAFNALPKRLIRNFGWHLMAFAAK
jgi:ubiquinone/menaquinone biosynthesis C-methylase UbiE